MLRKILLIWAVVLVAACANIHTIPTEVAVTATPTEQRFGLMGVLTIPAGSPLVLAMVNETKAYCSEKPVAFISGENGRGACFFDTEGSGYFDRWMMLGKIGSITAGGLHIPYSVMATADFYQKAGPRIATENEIASRREADRLECQMNAQMASAAASNPRAIIDINAAATGAQVMDTCMRMMAARRNQ